ncbi:SAM-dependent methyltransferase [Streptomyces sp. NPDC041068]|uniref:SAM-dependent methyltransferase n=1 Tax=Streptomyces sp. NPDC041068 TaxID=3155130 RepID=UPI0033F95223
MTVRPDWVPTEVDTDVPSVARMYDVYVGGENNLESDRDTVREALTALPGLDIAIRANRAFLRRAVRLAASEHGITQFLDVGCGILTPGETNVHDVARRTHPDARVAYVDQDPAAVAKNRALLADDPNSVALAGDFLQPRDILDHADVRGLIDFDKPVALLLVAVLHFIEDLDDPCEKIRQFRDALAPGSVLILTHAYVDGAPDGGSSAADLQDVYRTFGAKLQNRGPAETTKFFDGFKLLEPALVGMADWRPDADTESDHPMTHTGVVGVAVKE